MMQFLHLFYFHLHPDQEYKQTCTCLARDVTVALNLTILLRWVSYHRSHCWSVHHQEGPKEQRISKAQEVVRGHIFSTVFRRDTNLVTIPKWLYSSHDCWYLSTSVRPIVPAKCRVRTALRKRQCRGRPVPQMIGAWNWGTFLKASIRSQKVALGELQNTAPDKQGHWGASISG